MTSPAPRPGADNVLILGPSKTGTTGLYTSIRNAYRDAGHEIRAFFEPKKTEYLDNVFRLGSGVPVLAKVTLPDKIGIDPLAFDRRVMTVRDPRDTLISTLLFRPLITRFLRRGDDAAIETFVDALQAKESDPSSVSVRELFDVAESVGIGGPAAGVMKGIVPKQLKLIEKYGFHVVKYEEFVTDQLSDLSGYLGIEVRNVSAEGSTFFGHIARSQSHGDFLHWFREDDLAYFNDLFRDGIERFGYPLDVELDPEPKIDPATASEYVYSRYVQRRDRLRTLRSVHWSVADIDSQEKLDELIDAAGNGDPVACERVAEVSLSTQLGPRDEATALTWTVAAAELGSVPAMRTAAQLLRSLEPKTPAAARAARAWELESEMRMPAGGTASAKRIAALEKGLASVRSSTSYRIGGQLARAAKSPSRNAIPAVRELLSTYRDRRAGKSS